MAGWGLGALQSVLPEVVVVENEPALADRFQLQSRADMGPGRGPLAGLQTALHWALERELTGVFALACDLPLVAPEVLSAVLDLWPGRGAALPRSDSPWGFEPLCGCYGTDCLQPIESALDSGQRSVGKMAEGLAPVIVEVDVAGAGGLSPFFNVNSLEEHRQAESALRSAAPEEGS
jgi:molybdopterin-guanine dinucleotide biosynthesis protein A